MTNEKFDIIKDSIASSILVCNNIESLINILRHQQIWVETNKEELE